MRRSVVPSIFITLLERKLRLGKFSAIHIQSDLVLLSVKILLECPKYDDFRRLSITIDKHLVPACISLDIPDTF